MWKIYHLLSPQHSNLQLWSLCSLNSAKNHLWYLEQKSKILKYLQISFGNASFLHPKLQVLHLPVWDNNFFFNQFQLVFPFYVLTLTLVGRFFFYCRVILSILLDKNVYIPLWHQYQCSLSMNIVSISSKAIYMQTYL